MRTRERHLFFSSIALPESALLCPAERATGTIPVADQKDCGLWERDCFFSSKDNRTVILTRQDFFPNRSAEGDLLFTFSSNIFDFKEVFRLI